MEVQSLGWEDPLVKGMATHSSILARRILWTEEPGGLHSMGSQKVGHHCATNTQLYCILGPTVFKDCSLYHISLIHQSVTCRVDPIG